MQASFQMSMHLGVAFCIILHNLFSERSFGVIFYLSEKETVRSGVNIRRKKP